MARLARRAMVDSQNRLLCASSHARTAPADGAESALGSLTLRNVGCAT